MDREEMIKRIQAYYKPATEEEALHYVERFFGEFKKGSDRELELLHAYIVAFKIRK